MDQAEKEIVLLQAQLNALYFKEKLREISSNQLRYTFIVVASGYGMLWTMWVNIFDYIPILAAGWAGVLMGFSILTFLSHEFYKTWAEGNDTQRNKAIIGMSPEEAVKLMIAAQSDPPHKKLYQWVWRLHFVGALAGGVGAFVLMVGGFFYRNGWFSFDPLWWKQLLDVAS